MAVKGLMPSRASLIVIITLASAAGVGVSWWIRTRTHDLERECIDHLRHIAAAKEQWLSENGLNPSLAPTPTWADLAPYLEETAAFRPDGEGADFCLPASPPDASYTIGSMSNSPTCTYAGHTYALYGLHIYVGYAAMVRSHAEDFTTYVRPEQDYEREYPRPDRQEFGIRPAGCAPGATVEVIDEDGHHYKGTADEDGVIVFRDAGMVSHPIGPSWIPFGVEWKPPPFGAERAKLSLIVSKAGFFTQSNYVRDPYRLYQYDYNFLLRQPENAERPPTSGYRPPVEPDERVSPGVSHHYAHSRLRLLFTPAYDQAALDLMIAEANRIARELGLAESVPIDKADARAVLATPADFIHDLNLGRLETREYRYWFTAGTTVSEVSRNPISIRVPARPKRQFLPMDRLDTNGALTFARQTMESAGVDMKAIDRDCTSEVAWGQVRPGAPLFMADYRVDWFESGNHVLFDDLPDQSSAAMKRKMWPTSPSWKMRAASLCFYEPARAVESFAVFDPKYIKKKPLQTLDLIKLLSGSNSEEAVLYEMNVSTNAAARRDLYIKLGAPLSVLREVGLEPANN